MCDDRDYEKRVGLYYKDYDKYLIEVMKEVIPRQLASLYKYNLTFVAKKIHWIVAWILLESPVYVKDASHRPGRLCP